MVSALLALLVASPVQSASLTLAADTYLDRKVAEGNGGREALLVGGIDKPILIRFPELGTRVGAGKRVRSARLVFSLAVPRSPQLAAVGRMLVPWNEGGYQMEQYSGSNVPKSAGSATWDSAGYAKWERPGAAGRSDAAPVSGVSGSASTETYTLSGLESAVQDMIDVPTENFGLRLMFENSVAFFSADSLGSGPVLELELEDKPATNVDLQVVSCYPLEVNLASPPQEGSAVKWRAEVKNLGTVAATGLKVTVTEEGSSPSILSIDGDAPASPGMRMFEFTAKWRKAANDPARGSFTFRISCENDEANLSNNGTRVYQGGVPLIVTNASAEDVQSAVTDLNERVFPFSKFGAWPTGCIERVFVAYQNPNDALLVSVEGSVQKSILKKLTCLPSALLRPYATDPPKVDGLTAAGFVAEVGQAGLLPDTRDDVLIPRALAIPGRSTVSGGFSEIPMTEHKMLSRTETTILNTLVGRKRELPWEMTPNSIFIRVFTGEGPPPVGTKLDVYQLIGGAFGSQPVFSAQLGADGMALMTGRASTSIGKTNPFGDVAKDGSNGWLLAVVRSGDMADSVWIPVWQLWDEYARGNQAAAFIELRVQLLNLQIDRSVNLALGKLATDARGRFPAELAALTDGKNETSVSLGDEGDGYFIDLDLGRDRSLAEISLVFDGPVWKQFRILTYKTSQSAQDAIVWSEEANGPSNPKLTKTEDGKSMLSYLARPVRSRYVRIVPLSRESVKLCEIKVVPAGPN